ncbi:MAG: 30S ribosomal protein S4 [Candidatus Wildermuthbacteria bacterium]|nr:30S ribosomal protein S4 [Candidatus Wildermuthbacteria bacterium]
MQQGVVRKRRPAPVSEYGKQLQAKQELKKQYHLREKQMRRYFSESIRNASKGNSPELFMQALERRMDSAVFRAGMAKSRAQARQMVNHGHFLVNGKAADIPSLKLQKGDVVKVRPASMTTPMMQAVTLAMKKHEAPAWILLNKESMEFSFQDLPTMQVVAPSVDIALVFEFYSR